MIVFRANKDIDRLYRLGNISDAPKSMNAADALPPFAQYIKDHKARTIGRWFIGGIVDFVLTGAFIASTAEYWGRYRKHDSRTLKAFVLALLAVNIIKSVQTIHLIWYRLILNFGDFIGTATETPTFGILDPFFTEILVVMCQAFFAARLWKQTEDVRILRPVFIPMVGCILLGLAGYAALIAFVFGTNGSILGKTTYDRVANTAMGGVVAANLLITCIALYLALTRKAFQPPHSIRAIVVNFVWGTALLPCISEILKTIMYLAVFKQDAVYVVFHFTSCKLYSLSVIYILTSRQIAEPVEEVAPKRLPRRNCARRDSIQFSGPMSPTSDGEKAQHGKITGDQSYETWSTTFEFTPTDTQRAVATVPA